MQHFRLKEDILHFFIYFSISKFVLKIEIIFQMHYFQDFALERMWAFYLWNPRVYCWKIAIWQNYEHSALLIQRLKDIKFPYRWIRLKYLVFFEEWSEYGAKISLKCGTKKLTKHSARKSSKCGQRIRTFSSIGVECHITFIIQYFNYEIRVKKVIFKRSSLLK